MQRWWVISMTLYGLYWRLIIWWTLDVLGIITLLVLVLRWLVNWLLVLFQNGLTTVACIQLLRFKVCYIADVLFMRILRCISILWHIWLLNSQLSNSWRLLQWAHLIRNHTLVSLVISLILRLIRSIKYKRWPVAIIDFLLHWRFPHLFLYRWLFHVYLLLLDSFSPILRTSHLLYLLLLHNAFRCLILTEYLCMVTV